MNVSLPALKAFESAARLGSFKAAATELAISPTAVSHHINNLEQRLNVNLFIRETKEDSETANLLRVWMGRHHIRPKAIC